MRSLLFGLGVGLLSGLSGLAFQSGSVESYAVPVALANVLVLAGASLG